MRYQIAVFILFLATSSLVAASCVCGSPFSTEDYSFLGDSATDISMDRYCGPDWDVHKTDFAALSDVNEAAQNRMSLNLSDQSRMNLFLSLSSRGYHGHGNRTNESSVKQVDVEGLLHENKLSLDVCIENGSQYKFNLTRKGTEISGDYIQTEPNGREVRGVAEGKWVI